MNEKYAFVMMIHEKWWSEFCSRHHQGRKIHSYVHRGVAPPKSTSVILFYVTKPVGEIAGYADFVERRVGDAEEVWKEYGDESVLKSGEEYEELVKDRLKVSLVRFRNLHEASEPISLKNALMHLGVRRLSRKGFYVDRETADKLITLMK